VKWGLYADPADQNTLASGRGVLRSCELDNDVLHLSVGERGSATFSLRIPTNDLRRSEDDDFVWVASRSTSRWRSGSFAWRRRQILVARRCKPGGSV
jgi:hypothetical protein